MFDRRINRIGFLRGWLYQWGIAATLLVIFAIGDYSDNVPALHFLGIVSGILLILVVLAFLPFQFSLMTRRLHDVGRNWHLILLTLVPYVGLGLIVYLLFKPGLAVKNAYGPPVKDNRFWVVMGPGNPRAR